MQKITPHLWFDRQAEEAASLYVSIFSNNPSPRSGKCEVGALSRYGKEGFEVHGMPEGTAMVVPFTLDGQEFLALNAGPIFKFNESVSFMVHCADQAEVDYFWEKLSADPSAEQCGWLKDKFGLSWQIIPTILGELMGGPDKAKAGRVMNAMLQMKKIDIAALQAA